MQYYVYITTTLNNTVLYTGVMNDLKKRMTQHKQKSKQGFTKQYHMDKLVFFTKCLTISRRPSQERSKSKVAHEKRKSIWFVG
jgi:putative endonuclease